MKSIIIYFLGFVAILMSCSNSNGDTEIPPEPQNPPFSGTIFLDRDIIDVNDPSVYQKTTFVKMEEKNVFDRRENAWITINAFTFKIDLSDNTAILAVVNEEFETEAEALMQAEKYGHLVGQLPKILRKDIDELWIHKGVQPFGGGNRSILIHIGQSVNYENDGILEETLVHEASHTSLDDPHATADAWISSQNSDGNFISTYARDNPQREDIAESFLMFLAVKYREDRISQNLLETVEKTIPNRLTYFENKNFDLRPFTQ